MSRWIDADHLRKWILLWWERTEPTSEFLKGGDILDQIDREISIDIVLCSECKWYNCGACFRDDGANNGRNDDDFCSYGERKTDKPTHGYMWTCPNCGLEVHSDFARCPCCGYGRRKGASNGLDE